MKKVTLTVPWGQFDPIVKNMTTHIRIFQEFHDCHHLAPLPYLIHLHLFHCRNLTLHWTRGRFHPSSNCLQYRPHVHYRRHLTHLKTRQKVVARQSPSSCHYVTLRTSQNLTKEKKKSILHGRYCGVYLSPGGNKHK